MKKKTQKKGILKTIGSHLKGHSIQTLLCTGLLLTSNQSISPHGTVVSPPSRVWVCFQENPENPDSPACIGAVASHGTQAFYDWNEVARMDAGGNHRALIMDGNLASAGRPDKYGGLDQVRDDWVSTPVSPGPLTITWSITAPHATLYYEVYITKNGWTPNQPITWDSLELLVRTGEKPLSQEDNIDVILPNRTGKHVIYSIWQRSLSPEAFYSTSDVDFGDTLSIDEFEKSSSASLEQNYPNPFTGRSTIKYNLNNESSVNIKVYNVFGQEVSTLIDTVKNAGEHEVIFNADNIHSGGVYFYVFKAGNYTETRRMVLRK